MSGVSGNGREDMVYHRCPLGLVIIAWMIRQGQGILEGFRATTTRYLLPLLHLAILPAYLPIGLPHPSSLP